MNSCPPPMRSRNSIPPQATTLRPYRTIRKPRGVMVNFQKALSPILVASPQVCLGGNL